MKLPIKTLLLSSAYALIFSAHAFAAPEQNVEEYEGSSYLLGSESLREINPDAAATVSFGGTLSVEYRDNIYRSKLLKESDSIARFQPAMRIKTDLKPYDYQLLATADLGKYASDNENDYTDIDIRNRIGYDVTNDTNIYADGRFRYDHVDIGAFADDPDVLVKEPTTYRYAEAGAGAEADMPQWYASLDGRVEYVNYDNDTRRNGGRKVNDDRDHLTTKGTGRVGYKPYENTVLYVQAGANKRDYDQRIDGTLIQGRDSDGYELLVGVDHGAKKEPLWVDVGIGYMSQDYSTQSFKDVDTLALRGQAQYRPNETTRINAELTRDIRETTTTNSSSYIQSRARLRGETLISENWQLGGGVRYTQNDFQINRGSGAASRMDDVWDGNVYVDYMLTDIYSVGVEYIYVTRRSDVAAAEYDANTALVRVGARY